MAGGLKVLVVGGGVAGPSLALWLARLGCEVVVVERSAQGRHTGQQIDVRGYGVDVMKKMGIAEKVKERVVREPGTLLVDRDGKHRAYFPTREDGRGDTSISSEYEIMRGDLCEILWEATKDKVVYRYGVRVKGLEQVDEGVKVSFDDDEGKPEVYDLVVGCDGVRSATRKMMLGEGAKDPFCPTGGAIAWVTIPTEEGDTRDFVWYASPGKRLMGSRKDRDDCLRAYFITSGLPEDHPIRTTLRSGDIMEQRKAWAAHYKGMGWQSDRFTREVVESTLADDFHASETGQVKMERWYEGRVALLGDAAYCPSPAGWGTAMAFVGAYVMAGELARHCGLSADAGEIGEEQREKARKAIPDALKAYDETLRPLIVKVQKVSRAGEGLPSSRFAISMFLAVMGLVERLKLDRLMMRLATGGGSDFGWKLPEYAELGVENDEK
ncbi:hypothetical protein B0T16DRAFT_450008 [Cercophora newfieldiana]|uniref:FAD-binding domain-containing protein n=1 Tax=Cercophora newfieldiana TaxID=92897 RepID=A0AA39XT94_9PEZI|nr:hypothetical protein B0T16DRAFT_450008 [Cercophora newfieldiana]